MIPDLRQRARLWSAVALAAVAVCIFFVAQGLPLQTNLLALLPATERDPVAEEAVVTLNNTIGDRVVFLVSYPENAMAGKVATRFAELLETSSAFSRVIVELPPLDPAMPLALYGPHRFGLLTDDDRAILDSGQFDASRAVLSRLISPMSTGVVTPLVEDPFGFLAHWLARLPTGMGTLALSDGLLIAREENRTYVLILAQLDGASFDNSTQTRTVTAFETARKTLLDAYPDAQILHTGTVFYAAAARADAEHDVHRIALGSLLGIAILFHLIFRSFLALLLGMLSVGIGVAVAMSVILLGQGQLHLITLVFGASLIGEAIDYSIQYFATNLDAGSHWNAEAGLARIRPALTLAVTTSLLSYALLGVLPFPGIAQIALFALIGLTAAYLSVLWLLPALLIRANPRDPVAATRWATDLLEKWRYLLRGHRAYWAAGLALLISVPGWYQLKSDDNIRLMVARLPELGVEEAAIRRLTGFESDSRFFLIRGASPEEVLEREHALVLRLRALKHEGALKGYQAVSDFVPPGSQQAEDNKLLARTLFTTPGALGTALEAVGFRPDVVTGLQDSFRENTVLTVDDWLRSPLSIPYRHLWQPAGKDRPASVVTLSGERHPQRVAAATLNLPGVSMVDKVNSVSELLGSYRKWGGPVLLALGGVIFLVLAWHYPLRAAANVMLPVVLAEGISVGIFGYVGESVTLFAIMGWGLTLGIGINYAIFLYEGRGRASSATAGVLLSAATTLLSFGLLALSSMPALRQFGLALFTGIAIAVVFAPLALEQKSDT
ncbi:MAG: MMPL family transporter [Gammaproteobacteria bacterium]|jgi:predicted exporter